MATPPTVLANDASTPPIGTTPVKRRVAPLLLAVLAGVALTAVAAAGTVYVLSRTGRLSSRSAGATERTAAPLVTHLVTLDPMLVNLADTSGTAYLKISMVLQVANAPNGKDSAKQGEAPSDKASDSESAIAARDTALAVLGRQTSDTLLAADGKERLKSELKSELSEHNPQMKVVDIFFTDFLVQR